MIYVHIPFCRSFCTYCDFYSEIASGNCRGRESEEYRRYAESLVREVEIRQEEIKSGLRTPEAVNTLYIGGGTPSVLPLYVYRALLDALRKIGVSQPYKEFTMEVNPDDIVEKGPGYVEEMLELGVDRVSMGVQSFDDGILKWMNRRHDGAAAIKAYHILEEAGVRNISIDLIFGLPQLTEELWKETLDKALSISSKGLLPNHISSYQLSVEPGSALASYMEKGQWSEATDNQCSNQYAYLCERLTNAGYEHYEISNFALPGYRAVHNSAYWSHVPYVGLGPGAHSFQKGVANIRRWNNPDLRAYQAALVDSSLEEVQGHELLDGNQMAMEKVMLGLRTAEGVSADCLMDCCRPDRVASAMSAGHLQHCGENVRIPESFFFISDSILSSII